MLLYFLVISYFWELSLKIWFHYIVWVVPTPILSLECYSCPWCSCIGFHSIILFHIYPAHFETIRIYIVHWTTLKCQYKSIEIMTHIFTWMEIKYQGSIHSESLYLYYKIKKSNGTIGQDCVLSPIIHFIFAFHLWNMSSLGWNCLNNECLPVWLCFMLMWHDYFL